MSSKPNYIERFLALKPRPKQKKHRWHDGETHLFQNPNKKPEPIKSLQKTKSRED